MGESNETIVSLEQARDIYGVKPQMIGELISIYDRTGRQIFRLAECWSSFKLNKPGDYSGPNPNPSTTPAS